MKNPSVQNFSSLIADKMASDRELIDAQTKQQLELHAKHLKKMSDDALLTTRGVIDHQRKAVKKLFDDQQVTLDALMNERTEVLKTQIQTQTKRLVWMMRGPMIGMILLCLLMCAGTWGFWQWTSPYQVRTIGNLSYQVMKGEGWTSCDLDKQKRPCRLMSSSN